MANVTKLIERHREAALAIAKRSGKTAHYGRVTIIPAFDGRYLPMDERKRLLREVGGETRRG